MDLETFLFRVKMMDWVSLAKIYLMLEKTRDDKKYKPEQEADLNALMEGCKKACDHLAAHNLATAQPHILFLFDETAEGAKSSYTMPKLKEGALIVGIQGAGNFPYGMHDYDCLNIELDPKSDLLAYGDLHSYAGFSQPISNIGVREKVKHRKITLDDIDWIVRACAEFSQNVENLKTFTAQPNLQIT